MPKGNIKNLRTPSTEEARKMQLKSAQKRSQNIKERLKNGSATKIWKKSLTILLQGRKKIARILKLCKRQLGRNQLIRCR